MTVHSSCGRKWRCVQVSMYRFVHDKSWHQKVNQARLSGRAECEQFLMGGRHRWSMPATESSNRRPVSSHFQSAAISAKKPQTFFALLSLFFFYCVRQQSIDSAAAQEEGARPPPKKGTFIDTIVESTKTSCVWQQQKSSTAEPGPHQ